MQAVRFVCGHPGDATTSPLVRSREKQPQAGAVIPRLQTEIGEPARHQSFAQKGTSAAIFPSDAREHSSGSGGVYSVPAVSPFSIAARQKSSLILMINANSNLRTVT